MHPGSKNQPGATAGDTTKQTNCAARLRIGCTDRVWYRQETWQRLRWIPNTAPGPRWRAPRPPRGLRPH
eukprot:8084006-Lingulodinium_polyedra.AAC.1